MVVSRGCNELRVHFDLLMLRLLCVDRMKFLMQFPSDRARVCSEKLCGAAGSVGTHMCASLMSLANVFVADVPDGQCNAGVVGV